MFKIAWFVFRRVEEKPFFEKHRSKFYGACNQSGSIGLYPNREWSLHHGFRDIPKLNVI
jgi:hypothetical protein